MNRKLWAINDAAKDIARRRILERTPTPIIDSLAQCRIEEGILGRARLVLEGLASVLGVNADRLRPTDLLGNLVRVGNDELAMRIPQSDWNGVNLDGNLEVFCYDIMEMLTKLSNRRRWNSKWLHLEPKPRNEEDWINLILTMTLCEFISFFADTIDP